MAVVPPQHETGSVPVPDPTTLTKEATEKTEASLRAYVDIRVEYLAKNVERLQKEIDGRPALVVKEVEHLRELVFAELKKSSDVTSVQFDGVNKQFENGEKNLSLALTSAEKAVQKQNESSEKAILKSETSTAEKISGLQTLFDTSVTSLGHQFTDLKERMDRGEGKGTGAANLWGFIVGGIGMVSVIIGIFVTIYSLANKATAVVEPTVVIQKADGTFTRP